MKDEIKKILKKIKSVSNFDDYVDFVGTEFKPLLDYITNLQEENGRLKRDIEAMKHNYNLLVRLIENGESMTQKFENALTGGDE